MRWYIRKQLSAEYQNSPLHIQLLKKEFEIGQHLDHTNIVKYLFLNQGNKDLYILMDFIDGVELESLLLRNEFDIKYVNDNFIKSLIHQIGNALSYLQSKGIIHGDISAKNIIYNFTEKKFYLIDFGHAVADQYIKLGGGTRPYISPEAINSPEKIDFSSECYSFGKLLERVFNSFNITKYNAVIRKCCEPDQKVRYRNIEEVLSVLNKVDTTKRRFLMFAILPIFTLSVLLYFIMNKKQDVFTEKHSLQSQQQDTSSTKLTNEISKPVLAKQSVPIHENVIKSKLSEDIAKLRWEDTIVRHYGFLTEFENQLTNKMSIDQMRNLRNDCIVSSYNKYKRYLEANSFSEKELSTLNDTYAKLYFQEYKKSDSLIRSHL